MSHLLIVMKTAGRSSCLNKDSNHYGHLFVRANQHPGKATTGNAFCLVELLS